MEKNVQVDHFPVFSKKTFQMYNRINICLGEKI